jgi:predicted phage terminase large subunit-like protein
MLPGDKEVKAAPMEQIFYAGNVHLLKAPWNKRFIEHFTSFPDGTHDDYVDATAVLYHEFDKPTSRLIMTR